MEKDAFGVERDHVAKGNGANYLHGLLALDNGFRAKPVSNVRDALKLTAAKNSPKVGQLRRQRGAATLNASRKQSANSVANVNARLKAK